MHLIPTVLKIMSGVARMEEPASLKIAAIPRRMRDGMFPGLKVGTYHNLVIPFLYKVSVGTHIL
jgi:hypothetical protein